MSDYETVIIRKIYDNVNGTSLTVRDDVDALGLVEIDGGEDYGRIVLLPELAIKVADAMAKCAAEIIAKT